MVPPGTAYLCKLIERAADLTDYLTGNFIASNQSVLSDTPLQWPPWDWAWSRAFLGNLNPGQLRHPLALRSKKMLPQWARDLQCLVQDLDDDPRTVEINSHGDPQDPTVLAKSLITPVTAFACKKLSERIPAHHRVQLSPAAEKLLVEWLEERLTDAIKHCVELHFRAFVAVGRCSRRKSEMTELAKDYARPCASRLFQLIEANPPLGKIVIVLVQHWIAAIAELLERLACDRQVLAKHFRVGDTSVKVKRLRIGLSDPKVGGKSVVELTFAGGRRIIYKPRDLLGEVDWFSFLDWANKKGWKPPFRVLGALARDGYGWLEGIRHIPCRAPGEVRQFFFQSGGLLCLMHLLGATDCHQENVIALGADPVLVDAETLGDYASDKKREGDASKVPTIFRTGYLPIPAELDPLAIDYSWSALEPVLQRGRSNVHLPRLGGRSQSPRNFGREIVEGFSSMTDFLFSNRADRQLRKHLSRIAMRHPRRFLYRNTRNYVRMIEASLSPAAMRSGMARSATLLCLIWPNDTDPAVARQELFALSQLDIPSFSRSTSLVHCPFVAKKSQMEETLAKLPTQLDLLKLAILKR
jgi:lantibiotic modifying enzyme